MEKKWYWGYLRPQLGYMVAGMIIVVMTSVMAMVAPKVSQMLVDDVILGGHKEALFILLGAVMGVTVLRMLMRYGFQIIFEVASQGLLRAIRMDFYNHIQRMDFGFFSRTRTGDIMARASGDMDAVRHFTSWVIYQWFENGLVFLFAMIMLTSISWKLALATMLITPVLALLAVRMGKQIKPMFHEVRQQFSKLNSAVQENISGHRVVKAFAREAEEIDTFEVENRAFREKSVAVAQVSGFYVPLLDWFSSMLTVVMVLGGGIMVIHGEITFGQLVAFNGYLWALANPMRMLGGLVNDTQRASASMEKLYQMMSEEPAIRQPEKPVSLSPMKGEIRFENVSFSYSGEKVLDDVSFTIPAGSTVAIMGPTGAGKTSVMNLLYRFYDVDGGAITIDGVDVRQLDLQNLRGQMAVAMQDVFLFSDTIEGNIAYGLPDADDEKVRRSAELACAEFIDELSEGFDTIVGERGVGLSGGQRQRIALARALLKNPSVLILDDTTSAVDMETEHAISTMLRDHFGRQTTLIVAHRIASVKDADMILVIENGKIIEQGRHHDLLTKHGYYSEVYQQQMGDLEVAN